MSAIKLESAAACRSCKFPLLSPKSALKRVASAASSRLLFAVVLLSVRCWPLSTVGAIRIVRQGYIH